MELYIMGTSSGVPTKSRNVTATAVCIQQSKNWYLVDCGEGTQHQLLRLPLSLANLKAIFITHCHGDHTYGLPGLLASAAMMGREETLEIICPPEIESFVKQAQQQTDMFVNYPIKFITTHSSKPVFQDQVISVDAVLLSHRVTTHGFVFTKLARRNKLDTQKLVADEIPRGPLWGEIQQGNNVQLDNNKVVEAKHYLLESQAQKRIIVAGDNDTPECLAEAVKDADVLMHESTYTQDISDKVGPTPMHSSAKKVAQFAQTYQLANLILTHFSARYHFPEALKYSKIKSSSKKGHSILEIQQEAQQYFSGNLFLANDFDHFVLDDEGHLTKSDK